MSTPKKNITPMPMIRVAAAPAFNAEFVNFESKNVVAPTIAPTRTRKKRPLADSDPTISKSITMRTSVFQRLQEIADDQQMTAPGGANLSLYLRVVVEQHLRSLEKPEKPE